MMTVRARTLDLLDDDSVKRIRHYAVEWRSYVDPPLEWYKTYSSMKYAIEPVFDSNYQRLLHLTPVPNAVVYTFDTLGQIIMGTRELVKQALFNDVGFATGVDMYRAIAGPPREHHLYSLPPFWSYGDKD